jgi:hypothetical protein
MLKAFAILAYTALPVIAAVSLVVPIGTLQTCEMKVVKFSCITTSKSGVYASPDKSFKLSCTRPGFPVAKGCTIISIAPIPEPIPIQD